MEKVEVKELYKRINAELYKRINADKQSICSMFLISANIYSKRDTEIYHIKEIIPNQAKTDAIRSRDKYADYVQDFHFVCVNVENGRIVFLDGHAGTEYLISDNKDELVSYIDKQREEYYFTEVKWYLRKIKQVVPVPKIKNASGKAKQINDLVEQLQSSIDQIAALVNG